MSTRRRTPTDLPTLRRSRSSFTGAITKAKDKLNIIRESDVSAYNLKNIERILSSVSHTEKGFLQTIEDAQEFIAGEETADTLQIEEDEALESFTDAISDVRDLAAELLSLKTIKKHLDDLCCDVRAIRDAFTSKPEADQGSALRALGESYTSLRREWNEADQDSNHPLKTRLDDCRLIITQLTYEMAGPKDRSPPSSLDLSSSAAKGTMKRRTSYLPLIYPSSMGTSWSGPPFGLLSFHLSTAETSCLTPPN